MKRTQVQAKIERQIAIGMITSEDFAKKLAPIFKLEYLKSGFASKVVSWCLSYFSEHQKVPGQSIEDIYEVESKKKNTNEEEMDLIKGFLESISTQYEHSNFNVDYVFSNAVQYFKKTMLIDKANMIKALAEDEMILDAEAVLSDIKLPQELRDVDTVIYGANPIDDLSVIETTNNPIVRLPGYLGHLMNTDLCRQSFVCFLGREKVGKTWLLMEMALSSLKDHNNVAFFQAGDMSANQQRNRVNIRVTGANPNTRYCGTSLYPVYDCKHNQLDTCKEESRLSDIGLYYDTTEFTSMLKDSNIRGAYDSAFIDGYLPCEECRRRRPEKYDRSFWYAEQNVPQLRLNIKFQRKIEKYMKRAGKGRLYISTHTNKTLTVSKIKTILDSWENEKDWVPDVIVIDYPDIMDSEHPGKDLRHQENMKWMDLRALSQDRNCLLIVATQADSKSYTSYSLGMGNFSEDKRKLSHVTSMWGINQTDDEKHTQLIRINPILMREGDFHSNDQAWVFQNLRIGKAINGSIKSFPLGKEKA